ncbi:MAG: uroporphyrinogen decarboxylase [Thermoplasma sp.]|nr:MAG: uroporphyrinogen decarboxylase [Thermoplasma sp.]
MDPFRSAIRGNDHDRIPVWFMRQAGRYLPSYMKYRQRMNIEEMMSSPDIIVEVTHDPVERIGVDAAIIFADITTPLNGMGIRIRFQDSLGPITENNIERSGVSVLEEFDASSFDHPVLRAISQYKERYPEPLIGFAGGPVTILSYIISDSVDRDLFRVKRMMITDEQAYRTVMRRLTDMVIAFARMQIMRGVDAFQIFDSWAGYLSPGEYERFVKPYMHEILQEISDSVPSIYFSTMTSSYIADMDLPADFYSIDWRVDMHRFSSVLPHEIGIQGNLDPAVVNYDYAIGEARRIIESVSGRQRYIFNTGHGLMPSTDPEKLKRLVEYVHSVNP